jgi:hypothetical protein
MLPRRAEPHLDLNPAAVVAQKAWVAKSVRVANWAHWARPVRKPAPGGLVLAREAQSREGLAGWVSRPCLEAEVGSMRPARRSGRHERRIWSLGVVVACAWN